MLNSIRPPVIAWAMLCFIGLFVLGAIRSDSDILCRSFDWLTIAGCWQGIGGGPISLKPPPADTLRRRKEP